jgi:anti-sigma factor ChrR (cupin superfamily)
MAGRILLGASEGNWQQMAPGIEAKMLWNDKTFLLRCAPGAQMAEHIHADKEHLLVLSGDLIIGNRTFLPGDYIGSPAGSDLFLHTTRTGCMLLSQIGA